MGKRLPRRGFFYIMGLLSLSLETKRQCHSKQLSYIQENLPVVDWPSRFIFFPLPHKDVLLKHQHCLSLLLISPSNDYLAPPEVELFLQTGWCEVGWGKPPTVETPLSPGNLAVAPSPGLTRAGPSIFLF